MAEDTRLGKMPDSEVGYRLCHIGRNFLHFLQIIVTLSTNMQTCPIIAIAEIRFQ
jgi:hypothetical protein